MMEEDAIAARREGANSSQLYVVQPADLPAVVAALKEHFPQALPLFVQARNMLSGKCVWPLTQLILDKFPDFTVAMTRPVPRDDNATQEYVVRGKTRQAVSFFAKDSAALRRFLRDNFMQLVDWYRPVIFSAVPVEFVPLMIEETTHIGNIRIEDGQHDNRSDHVLLLRAKDLQRSTAPALPAGYRLGVLEPQHIPLLLSQWKFVGRLGHGVDATPYFRYLLTHGFPSVALFDQQGQLVAGNIYEPDGNLGQGFVKAADGQQGAYLEIVNRHLAEKVFSQLGQETAWAYIQEDDAATLRSYEQLGAHKAAHFTTQTLDYIPYMI
ncbi:uncharacterized protein LOC129590332 isoform X2 [Paramacrobiotus metropolitanus]|uniref:uncharacterized protein LOC129590332 isoform X2 n=1 Tax=Paramacrobiotus metropolitanus TaxID=2943436 RepID=UPI002445B2A0|nr:uncharacterized protein LOC129590332 isoform X2 [Paramacrobiotus metropolitanus]